MLENIFKLKEHSDIYKICEDTLYFYFLGNRGEVNISFVVDIPTISGVIYLI